MHNKQKVILEKLVDMQGYVLTVKKKKIVSKQNNLLFSPHFVPIIN